jgi:hypothetical protein
VLGAGLDDLDLLTSEDPERLASGAPVQSLSDVRLLAPIVPPSIRDFSVFEQHIEGISRARIPTHRSPRSGTSPLSATSPTRARSPAPGMTFRPAGLPGP